MPSWERTIYTLSVRTPYQSEHLISQNTLSVWNGFVYIKMFTMEHTNYLLSFLYTELNHMIFFIKLLLHVDMYEHANYI